MEDMATIARHRSAALLVALCACATALCHVPPVRAESWLDAPTDRTAAVPITPAGSKRSTTAASPRALAPPNTLAALAVVGLGIAIVLGLARKHLPGFKRHSQPSAIHVLGHSPLGTKGAIYVVHCGPRVLIIGATPNQLCTLAEIADREEIEMFTQLPLTAALRPSDRQADSSVTAPPVQQLKGHLDGMLDRIDTWKASS